ncbi:hypothetical protein L6164_000087 [Bauhinia variegata]|uniref:Uncharacterized protein n=1 Tax=Bauhinia variegata TaxID=167791 RepID=A0ACB9Q6X7_BAUVA|nr:hypothetical protein L6164_000087 [Bauhinia variegata]
MLFWQVLLLQHFVDILDSLEARNSKPFSNKGNAVKVVALEVVVDGGTKVSEEEFRVLTELLMKKLLKLDTIEADGEAKLQRKAEKRIHFNPSTITLMLFEQNFVDTLDSLKARNSSPFGDNGNDAKAQAEFPSEDYEELHDEAPQLENTCVDSLVTARNSQRGEVHTWKLALGGSFLEKELERLVVGDCLPQEDALLLSRFLSVYPSMPLTNPEHSDSFISFGYRSLVHLLRFLEHHTPASVHESDRLE